MGSIKENLAYLITNIISSGIHYQIRICAATRRSKWHPALIEVWK